MLGFQIPKQHNWLKPLWETSPFLTPVVSSGLPFPLLGQLKCSAAPGLPVVSTSVSSSGVGSSLTHTGHIFVKAIKSIKDVPWPESDEALRSKALIRCQ